MIVIVNKFLPLSKIGMQVTVALVTLIALASILGSLFKVKEVMDTINTLPFSQASLPWLLPALLGIILSLILPDKQKSESFEIEA
jgi:branched-chain amino acid transport system II carrier protein